MMTAKELRLNRIHQGLCLRCKQPSVKGRHCERHAKYLSDAATKRQKKLKKDGKCVVCGDLAVNRNHCDRHRILSNRKTLRSTAARAATGVCKCGQPLKTKTLCESCNEQYLLRYSRKAKMSLSASPAQKS